MTKRKKILLSFLAGFLLLALILFGVALYLLSMAIDDHPLEMFQWPYNPQAVTDMTLKVQQIRVEMVDSKPGEIDTLIFNHEEVNAMIHFAIQARDLQVMFSDKPDQQELNKNYSALFKEGKFLIRYSQKLPFSTPFGSYLNIEASIVPELGEGKEAIKVYSAKIGKLSIPASFVEDKVQEAMEKNRKKQSQEQVQKIVTEMKVKDNSLVIRYCPAELRKFLNQHFQGIMSESLMNWINL